MTDYVCQDHSGKLFWAREADGLRAALDREDVRAPVNLPLALTVTVAGRPGGPRHATHGDWRIVAYAEGGWCEQRRVDGIGWCLLHACDAMPADVSAALRFALGLAE